MGAATGWQRVPRRTLGRSRRSNKGSHDHKGRRRRLRRLFCAGWGGRQVEYITVRKACAAEFVERKSRFIGSCRPVETEEEALAFIAEKKSRYWDASHNVYAYILREGNIQRFSDDGEPQGTAGIPVIEAMKKAGVTDAVV
ncbi:MAG: YigZ family protein, partial [Acutalibacter sp.]|nr:YigZ family protein [Acutalibacter sp.]